MILRGFYLFRRLLTSARRNRQQAQADKIRDSFYLHCWREAAEACGAELAQNNEGVIWITQEGIGRPIYVNRNLNLLDSHASVRVTDDKPATYRLLREAGAPVPDHVALRADANKAALEFMRSQDGPVVVKPAAGTAGGVGVTSNIRTATELRHAMAWAGAYCSRVLIERHIQGDTYRLLYLNGELLDCVLRKSPSLVGDGSSTVRGLVRDENRRRLAEGYVRSQSLLIVDGDMKAALALQGLGLESVPEAGREFTIKYVANDNSARDNITALERLSCSTARIGRKIVDKFGLKLVGMDLMTSDIGQDLAETGGAVIDINGDPGFYCHYFKNDDRVPLAEYILKEAIGSMSEANLRPA
jgi:D-alanine-D-alanine ligase-like ATP-grasp enzyme